MTLNPVHLKWINVFMLFITVIMTKPHMTSCLKSIKGIEARLGCMEITHIAQNYSELESVLMASKHRGTLRQDKQFCLHDVKHSEQE